MNLPLAWPADQLPRQPAQCSGRAVNNPLSIYRTTQIIHPRISTTSGELGALDEQFTYFPLWSVALSLVTLEAPSSLEPVRDESRAEVSVHNMAGLVTLVDSVLGASGAET